jgi:protein ImuA
MAAAPACWPTGHDGLDAALGGGLLRGRVHEIHAAEAEDGSAAAGFAVAVALGMAGTKGDVLMLRSRRAAAANGILQAAGWTDLGGAPARALFGVLADVPILLRAAVDAMRARSVAVVIVELWGETSALDLTAHRRLALAAEKSAVPLLLVRTAAALTPSTAQTRWQVAAAPSQPLPGRAPGLPAFAANLLRQRGGRADLAWLLEWDRDQRIFREPRAAPLSGAVVPVPLHRALAPGASPRIDGTRAAA